MSTRAPQHDPGLMAPPLEIPGWVRSPNDKVPASEKEWLDYWPPNAWECRVYVRIEDAPDLERVIEAIRSDPQLRRARIPDMHMRRIAEVATSALSGGAS
jgi:hypothetical protein